jgi:hypothetical protein
VFLEIPEWSAATDDDEIRHEHSEQPHRGTAPPTRVWLTVTILAHLVVLVIHGNAHAGAHVSLSREAVLFV